MAVHTQQPARVKSLSEFIEVYLLPIWHSTFLADFYSLPGESGNRLKLAKKIGNGIFVVLDGPAFDRPRSVARLLDSLFPEIYQGKNPSMGGSHIVHVLVQSPSVTG